MALVDWNTILSPDVAVLHSNLATPEERDEIDREVAAFRTSSGYVIDVEWDNVQECYCLTLFKDDYQNEIDSLITDDVSEVITTVAEWCSSYSRDVIGASAAGTSHESVCI